MNSVMLALSTFRLSRKAVDLAFEKASKGKHLVVVFVVDVNISRYMIGSDTGVYPKLKHECEKEILKQHQSKAAEKIDSLAKTAEDRGIEVKTYINTGRFAFECLEVIKKEHPEVIVTTRSKRPEWVKKLFGSPVSYLIANAGCPVIEA